MAGAHSAVGRSGILLVLAAVILAGAASTAGAGPRDVHPDAVDPGVAAALAGVSPGRIYSDLYALQNFSTRYAYSPGAVEASQYIYDAFSANPRLQVSFQDFTFENTAMRNVVAILPGEDPTIREVYVVGAHYDSTSNSTPMTTAPGADDDGSGTAGVIEAARVLSRYRLNATVVFGAWGAEEEGLVGSEFYCSCLASGSAPVGLEMNLDMIGNDPLDRRGLQVVHDIPSDWAADRFIALAAEYGLGLAPVKVYNTMPNSDHASFWAQGWPALLLIERDFSPVYHSNLDTIDRLNMGFVTETTRGAVATLATLAGIHTRGRGTVVFDRERYGVEGSAGIRVDDADLNANPAVADTATVRVASPREPGGEAVTLTETGTDTGLFAGTALLTGAAGVPGRLQVAAGDTITVTYTDASPAAVLTDTATIDGTVPRIRNLAVIPDVARATVQWETTEPTDAVVAYGTAPPLASVATDPRPSTSHRVELVGLRPDTAYVFDARSTDDAGQTAVADNGGLHFGFTTLIGVSAIPDPGRVGYLRSPGLTPNYFLSNRLLSGYSTQTGATYVGGVQFDTAGAAIPAGATVIGAAVHLWGQAWVYNDGPGTWTARVLNGSVDAGWATADYAAVTGAPVDFDLSPALTTADLAAGEWTSLSVPAPEFGALRARLATGALSLRIDGPTAAPGRIFDWATGYPPPCSSLTPSYPEIEATYSMAGDTAGPWVSSLRADPNPSWGASTNLSAVASDADTGGTPIARVEAFVDADPGVGLGMPMGAADGAFDAVTERATRVLDLSALPPGTHNVSVRAEDLAGNWGPASSFTLYVAVRDPDPPTVVAVSADPPVQELGLNTTLRAVVTDTLGVAGVDFAVRDASGSQIANVSAAWNPASGEWEASRAYPEGLHTFTAWGRDTGGNLASASGGFEVRGGGPTADAGPDLRVERGRAATLDGSNSTDDVAVVRWEWTVSGPGGTWTYDTSVASFMAPEAGVYVATLRVWDAAGRTASDTTVVTVTQPAAEGPPSWTVPALFLVVVLTILLVLLAAAARRSRKRREPPPSPPPG